MKKEKTSIHPIIALKEKNDEEVVAFRGYAGAKSRSEFRLYPDLTAKGYYEIPEKSILHVEEGCKDCKEEGYVTVYVAESAKIKVVHTSRAAELSAVIDRPFSSPSIDLDTFDRVDIPGLSVWDWRDRLFPGPDCVDDCIRKVKETKGVWTFAGGNKVILNAEGKKLLYDCLKRCGYSGSLLLYVYKQAVKKLARKADLSGDPDAPDIPGLPDFPF